MNYTVTIENKGITVEVPEGTDLLTAQRMADLNPDAPCGGTGKCKKCLVRLVEKSEDGSIETRDVVACTYPVRRDLTIRTIDRNAGAQILMHSDQGQKEGSEPRVFPGLENNLLAAFDIGTTTIAGFLIDAADGKLLAEAGVLNPQAQFGGDVISRCIYAQEHGSESLSEPVRRAVSELLVELGRKAGSRPEQISQITICGYTAMHHLFLGIPTDPLVKAPYPCGDRESLDLKAASYGLPAAPGAILTVLPLIGSFVGADTAACIESVEFDRQEKPILMIDIGTNGEIVLGNKNRRFACSTAAGPAFEGANIHCGMRGADGAVDHIDFDGTDLQIHVIGEGRAKGICGSGLLDAASVCLEAGLIRPDGRILDENSVPESLRHRMCSEDGIRAVRLDGDVVLTQKDIRELQLAKAALAAGITILMKRYGIADPDSEIGDVLIAGAFGTFLRPESACRIGLIPGELYSHIRAVGNAAGKGARDCVLSQKNYERCVKLAGETEFVELAAEPDFQELYVGHMYFPE